MAGRQPTSSPPARLGRLPETEVRRGPRPPPPHIGIRFSEPPKSVPLLCCFAGVDWATTLVFRLRFLCRIQIHGGVAGLVLVLVTPQLQSVSFCLCLCLDRENQHTVHLLQPRLSDLSCAWSKHSLLPSSTCFLLPPSPLPRRPSRDTHTSFRSVQAASLLATALKPPRHRPTPVSRPPINTRTRWVNHGRHELPAPCGHPTASSTLRRGHRTQTQTLTTFATSQSRTHRMAQQPPPAQHDQG